MAEKMQIVVAWVVEEVHAVGAWRADLGARPKMESVRVGRAAMWRAAGTEADVAKAQTWAAGETNYKVSVFTYSARERDPLGRARREVVAS